jgi:murein DD-endopeptidase MepM/ murein hydrolase activator NlpD
MQKEKQKTNLGNSNHKGKWLLLAVFFAGAIFAVQQNVMDFRASVIPIKTAAPYDGTSLPILNSPKWTALTSAEYKASYELIPSGKLQSLPTYDANVLKTPTEQLGWKIESDLAIRNAKITFSVPYMGNYKLDGIEYAGSHLAVDIKIPDNTPVYSIGNGIVVKVAEQSSGFGRHIVIKHEGFPALDDPNAKTTIYSSYNHLNEVLVSEGDVVIKGQHIAKSGHSGLSTTPHLHFQIDNDKAPWHPYWPFTYQDYSAAGLTFNGAIDAGLGKEKALLTTINPLVYVQKYMKSSPAAAPAIPSTNSVSNTTVNDLPPAAPITNTPSSSTVTTAPVTITSVLPTNTEPATTLIETQAAANPEADRSEADNTQTLSQTQAVQPSIFKDVAADSSYYNAVLFLKDNKVLSGYPDGSFKPDAIVSRVEALKFILNANNENLKVGVKLPFKDTSSVEWYSDYVATAFEKSIVKGYPDNTFKPSNSVNKAEFLKMLLISMNFKVDAYAFRDVFNDVKKDSWYAVYVKFANDKNLIDIRGHYFKPTEGMTRAEVAELLYRAVMLKISGAEEYSTNLAVADSKLSNYFQ